MNETIKLFEYEPLSDDKITQYGVTNKQIDRFLKKQPISIIRSIRNGIKASSYVGIFSIGKTNFQIVPKIAEKKNDPQIVKNLLYLLNFTKRLKITEVEISNLCERKTNFFEIVIYLFAKNLLELIKHNFRRSYQPITNNLLYLKGKIVFHENIRQNLLLKNKLYCKYFEYTQDILLNQIFKYVTLLLKSFTHDNQNYKILKELDFIFSDVSFKFIKLTDFDKIHLDRLTIVFKPLLDLSKLFILNSSIELTSRTFETFSFVFNMDKLFEEFVFEYMNVHKKSLFKTPDIEIKAQSPRKNLISEPVRKIWLQPDIAILRKRKVMGIIDTKYKLLEDIKEGIYGISEADIYQVLTYAFRYQTNTVVLLYPKHLKNFPEALPEDPYIVPYENGSIELYVRTINLNDDLLRQKKKLKDEFTKTTNIFCK